MTNRKIINQLIQLQELVVARMQTKAAMPKAPLEALDRNISQLGASLPERTRAHLGQLLQKHPEAVVPVVYGTCSGCGMRLSKSRINEVAHASELYRCHHCARYIYCPSEIVERAHVSRVYGEKQKIGLARFSAMSLMVTPLTGETPEEVLGELCSRLEQEEFVQSAAQLLDLALQREAIVSTAVDSGMAFPHVRGVEGGGLTLGVGIHKKGIHFGGPGRTLTRIFFFMVIPTATSAFYLKLISGLSRIYREKEAREVLLAAAGDEELLWNTLIKQTRKVIK